MISNLINGDDSGCGGKRFNVGKLKWHLLPLRSLSGVVRVLEKGEAKYGKNNWTKGMNYTTVWDSLFRHVEKFQAGEDLDEESGESHLDHIICNALFLKYYKENGVGMDDRK